MTAVLLSEQPLRAHAMRPYKSDPLEIIINPVHPKKFTPN
jgi:hypothetical protein